MPVSRDKLDSLTALRGIAAILVVIHHTVHSWAHDPVMRELSLLGWLGVPFFFSLSGFVLMRAFAGRVGAVPFILRRFCRIYPLHILMLIVTIGLFIKTGGIAGQPVSWGGSLLNLFLLQSVIPADVVMRNSWNSVTWTLSCELCFYLAAPYFFRLIAQSFRWRMGIMAMIMALEILSILAVLVHNQTTLDVLVFHPLPQFFVFLGGAVAAYLLRGGWKPPGFFISTAVFLFPIMIVRIWMGDMGNEGSEAVLNYAVIPGCILLIGALAYSDEKGRASPIGSAGMIYLGEISFALYMVHAQIQNLYAAIVHRVFSQIDASPFYGDLATLGVVAISCYFAALMHSYFEAPVYRALVNRLRLK